VTAVLRKALPISLDEHRHGNNGKSNDLDFLIFNYLLKAASIFSSKTDKCKVRPPFDCGIRASHCAFHVICNVQLCEILNTTPRKRYKRQSAANALN